MKEAVPSLEKSAQWSLITDSEADKSALKELFTEVQTRDYFDPEEDPVPPAGAGLILRKGDKAIGYAVFDIDEYKNKRILDIEYIHILNKERNPMFLMQLLKKLQGYAKEQNVTHVHWSSASEEMIGLSKHIQSDPETPILLPIKEFTLDTFRGPQRHES